MIDAVAFMKDLDQRFREVSGLSDRRYYSIFYSRLCPSSVMVIGIKPGGATDGSHQLASQAFYEDWEHEYVDMNYPIAAVMRPALMTALDIADSNDLRRIPKTNTFFQRAVGTDDFTAAEISANARQCAPFLDEMIRFVNPGWIVLEGMGARDNLIRHLCASAREVEEDAVYGMRFGRRSRFFRKDRATLRSSGREVTLLTVGHPSRFGRLPDWPKAVAALHRSLGGDVLRGRNGDAEPPRRPGSGPANPWTSAVPTSPALRHRSDRPTGARHRRALPETVYEAVQRPPADFAYRPIHDFWNELSRLGPTSIEGMYRHMLSLGWRRPSGKPLTYEVMRIDMVDMARRGFTRRLED